MIDSGTLTQIKSWNSADRLELIEELWISLNEECFVPPLSEELRIELERRRDAITANPERSRLWDEVVMRVRSRFQP